MNTTLPLSVPIPACTRGIQSQAGRPAVREETPLKELIVHYRKIRPSIKRRIAEFRNIISHGKEDKIFSELCFCILTANANAAKCNEAVNELSRLGLLDKGGVRRIRPKLKGRVRFHNKKADYIVLARRPFRNELCLNIMGTPAAGNVADVRDRLVNRIKGYGYKEASHFLRNIGLGSDIAILDRHILKNLKRYGVIDKIPVSVGARKVYLDIEEKMRLFSKEAGIPMDELDLLFWSMQTGYIFK
ncbi:MAG: N-glycosylase/DNA lyase [Candidatus Omnitrophota bacterium]